MAKHKQRFTTPDEKKRMADRYREGFTGEQIAKEFGRSSVTVFKALHEQGVQMRKAQPMGAAKPASAPKPNAAKKSASAAKSNAAKSNASKSVSQLLASNQEALERALEKNKEAMSRVGELMELEDLVAKIRKASNL